MGGHVTLRAAHRGGAARPRAPRRAQAAPAAAAAWACTPMPGVHAPQMPSQVSKCVGHRWGSTAMGPPKLTRSRRGAPRHIHARSARATRPRGSQHTIYNPPRRATQIPSPMGNSLRKQLIGDFFAGCRELLSTPIARPGVVKLRPSRSAAAPRGSCARCAALRQ